MKKIGIIMLALVIAVCLCACGRKNNETPSTVMPSTDIGILPDTMPTLDTNIPDPSVDTQMPIYTEGTDGTMGNDTTDTTRNRTGIMN